MKNKVLKALGILLIALIVLGAVFHFLGFGYTICASITFVVSLPIGWRLKVLYDKLSSLNKYNG